VRHLGGTRNDGLGPRRHWEHLHRRMIWLLAGVLRASFRGRSARKGMGIRSHFQFRRTGSECALAIQPVTALLAELFPCEVVIKEYRRTAGAPIAILYGSCLGFGQLTRQSVHVKYPPCIYLEHQPTYREDHASLDATKVLTISSPTMSLEQFAYPVRARRAFRGLPEIIRRLDW